MHDASRVQVAHRAQLVVKDCDDVIFVNLALALDKLFNVRLNVLHYYKTIMETL